jgi:hypothetical protein
MGLASHNMPSNARLRGVRVLKEFSWLEAGFVKAPLSRPAY